MNKITDNKYNYKSNKYKALARKSQKALKDWRKDHPEAKIRKIVRDIYQGYGTIGIDFLRKEEVTIQKYDPVLRSYKDVGKRYEWCTCHTTIFF